MKSPTIAQLFPGMPKLEESVVDPALTDYESHILTIAHSRWPTSSLEIAEFLGLSLSTRDEKRILSSRITYHIKKLVEKQKLVSKRFGNALIVWPYEVETLRVMHAMMQPPLNSKEKKE